MGRAVTCGCGAYGVRAVLCGALVLPRIGRLYVLRTSARAGVFANIVWECVNVEAYGFGIERD